ncbi:MAG: hypothetical protein RI897_3216 [Verrucomicrobiota bacterium]|jgi:ABC-type nickel/cobalt efflux system permease component RcnA
MRGVLVFVMLQQAVPGVGKSGRMLLRDLGLIAGAGLALTLVLIIWAVGYVQKGKRRRKHHHHRSRPEIMRNTEEAAEEAAHSEGEEVEEGAEHRHRHRRRRKRRDHRRRNPSLAETGGLPPVREEEGEGTEAKE